MPQNLKPLFHFTIRFSKQSASIWPGFIPYWPTVLSFEMWFYLCFAALIWLRGGRMAGKLLPIVMAVGVAVMVAFYHSTWFLPKFCLNPMVLEFCAGCILYNLRNVIGIRSIYLMAIWGLISAYFVGQTQSLGNHWSCVVYLEPAIHRAIIWGGVAVCLVGIVTQMDLKRSPRWPRFLLLLGDASYSIYLISPAIMWTIAGVLLRLNKLIGHDYIVLTPFMSGATYILGTIFGGILLWKYFEVPATRKTKEFLLRFVPKTNVLAVPQASHQP